MVLSLLAAIRDRPGWSGLSTGVALAIKFQAVVMWPVLCVTVLCRSGLRGSFRFAAALAVAWGILAAPFFWAGTGRAVLQTYTAAAGYYPVLSVSAYNGWAVAQMMAHGHGSMSGGTKQTDYGWSDARPLVGPLSGRTVGLLVLGAYDLLLAAAVARRFDARQAIFAAALACLAFYQLPTEVHERYGVPACGFLALIAFEGGGAWFWAFSVALAVNEFDVLFYPTWQPTRTIVLSACNIALFAAATVAFARRTFQANRTPVPPEVATTGSRAA